MARRRTARQFAVTKSVLPAIWGFPNKEETIFCLGLKIDGLDLRAPVPIQSGRISRSDMAAGLKSIIDQLG